MESSPCEITAAFSSIVAALQLSFSILRRGRRYRGDRTPQMHVLLVPLMSAGQLSAYSSRAVSMCGGY